MTKKKSSGVSRKPLKAKSSGEFGRDLIAGAKKILAHVEGRKVMKEYLIPMPIDVKRIRQRMGMSQAEFAGAFCLNRRTVQQWEQGKAEPDLAVRAYLTVIGRDPDAVKAALGSDASRQTGAEHRGLRAVTLSACSYFNASAYSIPFEYYSQDTGNTDQVYLPAYGLEH